LSAIVLCVIVLYIIVLYIIVLSVIVLSAITIQWPKRKGQAMINKTLQRNLKIEQYKIKLGALRKIWSCEEYSWSTGSGYTKQQIIINKQKSKRWYSLNKNWLQHNICIYLLLMKYMTLKSSEARKRNKIKINGS
jgi:hypothetical protein